MSSDNAPNTSSPAPAPTPAPEPAPATPRPARSRPSLVSFLALLIPLLTAAYVISRDPPWGRLTKYNFSNPEETLRSEWRISANGDVRAYFELESLLIRKEAKERLASLEVTRTAEWEGKTALFIQYKVLDKKKKPPVEEERKEVVWYEKDESIGYWRRTFVDPLEVRETDKKLAEDINAWTRRPRPGLPGFGD